MSFTLVKNFRHFRSILRNSRDADILSKLYIHCTAVHWLQDEKPASGKYDKQGNIAGPPKTLKSMPREAMISKAMINYLEKKQKTDKIMQEHEAEYDLGRRHLANIMSVDEDELTPQRIKEAIAYLLPSGLFNKLARPMMEPPSYYVPHIKEQEFDISGRPYHYLFYTLFPNYHALMHKMAMKYETLNKMETSKDAVFEDTRASQGLTWIEYHEFKELFPQERLNEHHYNRFLTLIQRLYDHPRGYHNDEFFHKYMKSTESFSKISKLADVQQGADGRDFVITKGSRKSARCTVKMTSQGHGHVSINGQDITFFDQVLQRQAMLAPLQLCDCLDKFDIEVQLFSAGPSADSGAIRLAIARALLPFVSQEVRDSLRVAGYLTKDPRVRERKKPGQEKARRKFTWKRR